MINTEEFSVRLQKLLDFYNLSASAFAVKIGVQKSSISHILSGRNKPSLDFVTKVLKEFPDVELYWLLNGKGSFPKEQLTQPQTEPKSQSVETATSNASKSIDRIVIFYKDGTFKSFTN